jgi:ferritin-like metal-binding protein YciE
MPQSINDVMIEKLNQAYSAEQIALQTMPQLAQAATSSQLKQAFETHITETEQQVVRLEQAASAMGVQAEGAPCEAMDGLAAEGRRLIAENPPGPLLDVLIVCAAQAVEHHEIAAYGTMRSLATALGMDDVAGLMSETLEEEKATDETLTVLAETEINPAALELVA